MRLVSAHSTFGDPRDVSSLAGYLSGIDMNPKPVTGAGEHLRLGQEIYTHICAGCHGHDGQGGADDGVPRIAKQHYPYLRRQIDEVALLHRKLTSSEMTTVLRNMRPQEKDALADYISRLEKSAALLDLNPRDTNEPLPGPVSH
jgi:mono/diheme cytochrome c family protein